MKLSIAALVLSGAFDSASSLSSIGYRMDGSLPIDPRTQQQQQQQFSQWQRRGGGEGEGGTPENTSMNSLRPEYHNNNNNNNKQDETIKVQEIVQQQTQQQTQNIQSRTTYSDLLAATFLPNSNPKSTTTTTTTTTVPSSIFNDNSTTTTKLSEDQFSDILRSIDTLAFDGITTGSSSRSSSSSTTTVANVVHNENNNNNENAVSFFDSSSEQNHNNNNNNSHQVEEEELVLPFSATRTDRPGLDGYYPAIARPIVFTSTHPNQYQYPNENDGSTSTSTSSSSTTTVPNPTITAVGRPPSYTIPRSSFAGSSAGSGTSSGTSTTTNNSNSRSTRLRMQATTVADSAESATRSTSSYDQKMRNSNRNSNDNNDDDDNNNNKNDEPVLGDGSTVSERMLRKVPVENQAGGAGGVSTLDGFQRVEANWARLKAFEPFDYDKKLLRWTQNGHGPPPQFVATDGAFGSPKCWAKLRDSVQKELDYDVVICGGTLGIFFATYLKLQGHDVCVLEAGKLRGREQEWNISMDELLELLDLGILTQDDIDTVITTEFPACRSGFKNQEVTPLNGGYFDNGIGYECYTPDVLNLGVAPALLLERVAKRFTDLGGVIKEQTRLSGVCVSELVGTALDLGDDEEPITARLVLDCMGNASPISAQQRYGKKADGICAVVGSCAGGYDKTSNLYGDIIYTNQPIATRKGKGSNQYFWEAFPVGIGRGMAPGTSDVKTTYMFTYMDADEGRPSMLELMEDYWKLLPEYQPSIQNPENDLDVKRILFAFFPTYRDSPLKPEFSRVLSVGDASGIQSPLSFGGFGALTRHLSRVGGAISEALETDCLHKDDLGEINAYQPNLSAAWMFQKAMSVKMGQKVDPKFVNRLLATNFQVMDEMGETTMKPFLQDVVRFDGLVGSLARSFVADPVFMPQIVGNVGIPELVKWLGHLGSMGAYSVLDSASGPIGNVVDNLVKDPREKFQWRRRIESWKYGSGMDYKFPDEKSDPKGGSE